jgi:ubiquitin carboxyl-terminal hydrolase 4/11/15
MEAVTSWFAQENPQSVASEWFAVSMKWLSAWKVSVGLLEGEVTEVGPVDNRDLLDDVACYKVAGHIGSVITKPGLLCGVDYDLVPVEVWRPLEAQYGVVEGTAILRHTVKLSAKDSQVEVTLRPLLAVFLYKLADWSLTQPRPLYVSRHTKLSSVAGLLLEVMTSDLQLPLTASPIKLRKLPGDTDLTEFESTYVKSKAPCYASLLDFKKTLDNAEVSEADFILVEVPDTSGNYRLNTSMDHRRVKCLCGLLIQGQPVKCQCQKVSYCSVNCIRALAKIHSCSGAAPASKGKQRHTAKVAGIVKGGRKADEIIEANKTYVMVKESKQGLCGLQNLGNTCFMNSALQCLSHIQPLTDYFLSNSYLSDLNLSNPLGSSKASVAKAYATLVKELWLETQSSFSPWSFKKAIGVFAPVFQGFQQHDSQEMLSFTLDALHEDLNRIIDKPYSSDIPCEGLSEADIADAYWRQFLSRNSSIVTDCMYGQYRSEVTCPICANASLAFDPFLMLSVVIPNKPKAVEITVLKLDESPVIRMTLMSTRKPSTGQVKLAVKEKLMMDGPFIAASYKGFKFDSFVLDSSSVSVIGDKEQLVLVQVPEADEPMERVVIDVTSEDLYMKKSASLSRIVLLRPSSTLKEVHLAVFSHLTRSDNFAVAFPSLHQDADQQAAERPQDSSKKDLYSLLIVAEKSHDASGEVFTTKRKKNKGHSRHNKRPVMICSICSRTNCSNCPLDFTDSTTLAELLHRRGVKSELHLEVSVSPSEVAFLRQLNASIDHESVAKAKQLEEETKRDVLTLDDCLRFSTKPEKLREENAVYCGKCQTHVRGTKQMTVWRLPNILILHLKRFKQTGGYLKKLETVVQFPVEGLDMEEYLVGPKTPALYDLFAVSNHSGGIGGGHYTAYCRQADGDWHYFNDSSVSSARTGIVSSSAYVLLYRLRPSS